MSDSLTIYHNPRCSKSRGALALLEESNVETRVIRYLDTPPDKDTLKKLLNLLDASPRELLRKGEPEYRELGLDEPELSDDDLIQAMVEHPRLIERPIVVRGDHAVVARPPERVRELL